MTQLVRLPLSNQDTFFTLSGLKQDIKLTGDQRQLLSHSSLLALWQRDESSFNQLMLKYRVLKLDGRAVSFDISPQSLAYLMVAFENGTVQKYNMSTLEKLGQSMQQLVPKTSRVALKQIKIDRYIPKSNKFIQIY